MEKCRKFPHTIKWFNSLPLTEEVHHSRVRIQASTGWMSFCCHPVAVGRVILLEPGLFLRHFWFGEGRGRCRLVALTAACLGAGGISLPWAYRRLMLLSRQPDIFAKIFGCESFPPRVRSAELIRVLFSTIKSLLFPFFPPSPSWVGVFPSLLQQQNQVNSRDRTTAIR